MAPTSREVDQVVNFLKREQEQRLAASQKIKSRFLRASLGATVASFLTFLAITDQAPITPSFLKNPKQPVAVIAHGYNGNPENGLVGALKRQLEGEHLKVHAPQLPLGSEQTLENWELSLSKVADNAKKEGPVFLIGYSAGGSVVLHLVDNEPAKTYCGVMAVATVAEGNMPRMYRRFKDPREIVRKVDGNAGLIHSRDDTTLRFERAIVLSAQTGIAFLRQDTDGGHFTNLEPEALIKKASIISNYVQEMISKC